MVGINTKQKKIEKIKKNKNLTGTGWVAPTIPPIFERLRYFYPRCNERKGKKKIPRSFQDKVERLKVADKNLRGL